MSVYESNFETNRSVPLGSITTLRVVTVFERAIDAIIGWRNQRETSAQLRKLSDSQLSDIGLRRHDIADVVGRLAQN